MKQDSDPSSIECATCSKSFPNTQLCDTHTCNQPATITVDEDATTPNKDLNCQICGKVFKRRPYLLQHMSRVHHTVLHPELPNIQVQSPTLHLCKMCGCHFTHLFSYKRHLLRQHWFEAQKQFDETKKIEGVTEKQSQKLHELYRKLRERNSPTPPKRHRRSKPADPPYSSPRVTNLKEYKLVTVDDMSDAYRDKFNDPGGYTIFHFKVPKKNTPITSPALTALKKTYQPADQKTATRTEKIPVPPTTNPSFKNQVHQRANMARVQAMGRSGPYHGGCDKCSRKNGAKCASHCTKALQKGKAYNWDNVQRPVPRPARPANTSATTTNKGPICSIPSGPLHFASPLITKPSSFNCTDILKQFLSSPDSINKPKVTMTLEDNESVDEMVVDLRHDGQSPCSSSSSSSQYDTDQDVVPAQSPELVEQLAILGLTMVYERVFNHR